MSTGARRWSLRLPEQYRDLWPTFDTLLRYIDEKLASIAGLTWAAISGKPSTFPPSTHSHTSPDVSDFSEAVDDRVASLLVAGSNITLTYNDGANTLTVAAAGGAVATDTIWDAAGDLAVGTGANTAARLAVGTAGQVLTVVSGSPAWADLPAAAGVTYSRKASAQSITSSTTLTDDSVLQATLAANSKYEFEIYVRFTAAAAPDYKCDLNFTGTTTAIAYWFSQTATGAGNVVAANGGAEQAINSVHNVLVSGTVSGVFLIRGVIETGASGGTFSYRFAQITSSGTAISDDAGSYIVTRKIA